MGTLKSTLKLESTDLFPTPVSFTVVNNNLVNGDVAGFNNITVGPVNTLLNLSPLDGTGAYLYAQAPSTNASPIFIGYTGQGQLASSTTGTFLCLAPGDVAFCPIGMNSVATPSIVAKSASATGTLNFFFGEK
jgi:hypothetical protein